LGIRVSRTTDLHELVGQQTVGRTTKTIDEEFQHLFNQFMVLVYGWGDYRGNRLHVFIWGKYSKQ
jgi:hypothetical protein